MNSKKLFTAKEIRQMYNPAYTLEGIMAHIMWAAPTRLSLPGYDPKRMSKSVTQKLKELGFSIVTDEYGTLEIRWD